METVTIRLIDIEEQKRFEQEVETYELRSKAAQELGSGLPWPQYPKAPEPMVDSRDPGLPPGSQFNSIGPSYPGSPFPVVGRDLCSPTPLDFDGNSQSEVKGFESVWQCQHYADGERKTEVQDPFKIKE